MSERCTAYHPIAGISPMRCRLTLNHESPFREIGGVATEPFHCAEIRVDGATVRITWRADA